MSVAGGTVYPLLVRLEQKSLVDEVKKPIEKGPAQEVYPVNQLGQRYLSDFWAAWETLTNRIENLNERERQK